MAGSGTRSGIGFGLYVAVWNELLENVTLSPAAITSFDGRNWLIVPGIFLRLAGGGANSPRYTV